MRTTSGHLTFWEKNMKKKQLQPACSVEQLIYNLKDKNLEIHDEDKAKAFLDEVSYFRVIKAYSLGLKEKNGDYYKNISFDQIVELYTFNTCLRQLLFPQIERIEITLRSRIANYFSAKYGVLGYYERANFEVAKYHQEFLRDQGREVGYNSRSPFIKNFRDNYVGGDIPFYALVEVLTFGTLSKFYRNLLPDAKKAIASQYEVKYTYLQSWIESIAHVRNVCAHYGRLYNAKLSKTPTLYKEYSNLGISNYHIFAVILCMKHLLPNDYRWEIFVDSLTELFNTYPHVKKETMGFPNNWQDILIKEI